MINYHYCPAKEISLLSSAQAAQALTFFLQQKKVSKKCRRYR